MAATRPASRVWAGLPPLGTLLDSLPPLLPACLVWPRPDALARQPCLRLPVGRPSTAAYRLAGDNRRRAIPAWVALSGRPRGPPWRAWHPWRASEPRWSPRTWRGWPASRRRSPAPPSASPRPTSPPARLGASRALPRPAWLACLREPPVPPSASPRPPSTLAGLGASRTLPRPAWLPCLRGPPVPPSASPRPPARLACLVARLALPRLAWLACLGVVEMSQSQGGDGRVGAHLHPIIGLDEPLRRGGTLTRHCSDPSQSRETSPTQNAGKSDEPSRVALLMGAEMQPERARSSHPTHSRLRLRSSAQLRTAPLERGTAAPEP